MSKRPPPPAVPTPGTSSRRAFDADSHARAVEAQQQEDAVTPPTSLLSMMGVIRLYLPLIQSRRELNWTDPQIALFLQSKGIEIQAETLRVYRHRLRHETAPTPSTTAELPKPEPTIVDEKSVAPSSGEPGRAPTAIPDDTDDTDDTDDVRTSTFNPTLDLDDQV